MNGLIFLFLVSVVVCYSFLVNESLSGLFDHQEQYLDFGSCSTERININHGPGGSLNEECL